MSAGILAALGAALLWTLATRLFQGAGARVPPLELNLAKGLVALALFAAVLVLRPAGPPPGATAAAWLAISGAVGIGAGDTAYFRALGALGTRRVLLLELLAAPTAVLLSWLALDEALAWRDGGGLALILGGVALAVSGLAPATPAPEAQGERAQVLARSLWPALGWGLLAAFCQGTGLVLARAALRGGEVDPAVAAAWRLAAGAVCLAAVWAVSRRGRPVLLARGTGTLWARLAAAAALGTWLGIWLQQASLARLPAGVAQTLLATAPLFAMGLAALAGRRPAPRAWLGAAAAVAGVALLGS